MGFDPVQLFSPAGAVITAASGLAVSAVLGCAALRYRRLFLHAQGEQENSHALIENLHEGIYRTSMEGSLIFANPSFVKLNGYQTEADMLSMARNIGDEWYVVPGRRDEFRAILDREHAVEDFVSEVHRHGTRERIWVSESARLVRDPRTRQPLYYEGSVREITETVKRLELEELFSKLTSQLPGVVFQFFSDDGGGLVISHLSPAFERLCGLSASAVRAKPALFHANIHEDDRQGYFKSFAEAAKAPHRWEFECRYRQPSGKEKWIHITAAPERFGAAVCWHGYMHDISLRKCQEMEIEKLAFFDSLTGLLNRRALLTRLENAFSARRADGGLGVLLFIDLDNFKTLNDSQGHHIGDEYLVQVAQRIRNGTREDTIVARIGGDEFIVLIPRIPGERKDADRAANDIANRILWALRPNFRFGPIRHHASASIGAVVFDGGEANSNEVLKRADIAMYRAKNAGRNTIAIYDPQAMAAEAMQAKLLNDLRSAIAAAEFDLHFQPQIDRAGAIRGAEAFLCWRDPALGQLSPAEFPAAERPDLINEIDRLVVRSGIETLASWQRDELKAPLRLSLNISALSLLRPQFMQELAGLVAQHDVDASALVLELTEHVMTRDRALIAGQMREIRKLGIRFALDNFGTGYFSLTDLKGMPFDAIKIAGNFVSDLQTSESDRTLVKTMLAMARTLELESIAECVETDQQRIFLQLFGCNVFQGPLFSPALPLQAFQGFLDERSRKLELPESPPIALVATKKAG
ncbi:MAG: putative bifunctional diguanylate cyclase/phosphodiesterase [Rhizobiaceae bacterium]